jgi:hypothetical protein
MALFSECMQSCARKTLDTADILRDGDLSPVESNEPRMQRERKWYACARNDIKAVSFGRGMTPLAH